jgi:hypothetical protein
VRQGRTERYHGGARHSVGPSHLPAATHNNAYSDLHPGRLLDRADGARSENEEVQGKVCKVHETKFGLLLKAGNPQGTIAEGAPYSTDKEVAELLAESKNAEEFKSHIRAKFKQGIEVELVYLLNERKRTPQRWSRFVFTGRCRTNWLKGSPETFICSTMVASIHLAKCCSYYQKAMRCLLAPSSRTYTIIGHGIQTNSHPDYPPRVR